MNHFTTKQGVLFYNYTIEVEQTTKIDKFLELLESSGVSELLEKESSNQILGRPEIDSFRIFAGILYGFAMGSSSLRELENRHEPKDPFPSGVEMASVGNPDELLKENKDLRKKVAYLEDKVGNICK